MKRKDKELAIYRFAFLNEAFNDRFIKDWGFIADKVLRMCENNCTYVLENLPDLYIDLLYNWILELNLN